MDTTPSSETWLAVPGFGGVYQVSDLGRVRRLHKTRTHTLLKVSIALRGAYRTVNLCMHSERHVKRINQLVLITFVGPAPAGMTDARHLDGDKSNNRLDNLAWGTRAQNEDDKRRHGTDNAGERHGMHKLTDSQVAELVRRYEAHESPSALASEFGVDRSYPARLARGARRGR